MKVSSDAGSNMQDLNDPAQSRYFETVDKLRSHGVNEDLPLPQIVAVGDQSSGKSSLLEGLTGLSFPVAADLCTRFATQIVLRRTYVEKATVKASIIPGPSALNDDEQKARLMAYSYESSKDQFTNSEFVMVLDEAAECMGLPHTGSSLDELENLDRRFSDDILRIELSGPDEQHLSLVDVPGLFHNPTVYQTKEDLEKIRGLIEKYTTDSRTIMLAVMDARNNLANQEVFKMARAADPTGKRTVGIITKCDAVQEGEEPAVVKIAQNQVEKLYHGWFVVRNRSPTDIKNGVGLQKRHDKEIEFFKKVPWNSLSKDQIGVRALKPFLGKLLFQHIRNEFPALVKEIEALYNKTRAELEALGSSRRTSTEQRQYLIKVATQYETHVRDALLGNYDSSLPPKSELKLRMHLRSLAEDFASRMARTGHAIPFQNADGSIDCDFTADKTVQLDQMDILTWVRDVYRDSRGAELPGTVNPAVVENLFRQQSARWGEISRDYVKSAVDAISAFNHSKIKQIEFNDDIQRMLKAKMDQSLQLSSSNAFDKLDELLHAERDGPLQTVNHYFAENVNNIRQDRVLLRVKAIKVETMPNNNDDFHSSLMKMMNIGNEDQAVYDIHDALKAFYKVALKRFVDAVLVSVVEAILVGPDGPVRAFSSQSVGLYSDEELANIAEEDYATSSQREDISRKVDRLSQALSLARSM